ncbi:MAG: septation protein SepH [Dermatophilaceae bacterium]
MRDLHLIGVHEDGEHLLLRDDAGDEFRLRLDQEVRAAARREYRPLQPGQSASVTLGPREVQAMIRAGATAQETAERAGWTVDKVHKYDGPILAEREHIAILAGNARLRGRGAEHVTTLRERIAERLTGRGADPEGAVWDSWRSEDGQWTVELLFAAGGRSRTAAWRFNRSTVTVQPVDDEARWLSGDADRDPTTDYVVGSTSDRRTAANPVAHSTAASDPTEPATHVVTPIIGGAQNAPFDVSVAHENGERFDLAGSVRLRSAARQRRGGKRVDPPVGRPSTPPSPSEVPSAGALPGDEALPLADLRYDPDSMPPPPAAHADPDPDGVDGRPEPTAARAAALTPPSRAPRKAPRAPKSRPAPTRSAPDAGVDADDAAVDNEVDAAVDDAPTADDAPDRARPGAVADASTGQRSREPRPERTMPGTAFGSISPAPDGAAEQPGPDAQTGESPDAPTSPTTKKRSRTTGRGRASVPSWDDIMFGTRGPA